MTPLLSVENLSVSFGDATAVNGVTFDVAEGDVLGIVGESGSGKSLSVLSILGLVDRRTATITGTARFRGQSLLDLPDREMRKIRGGDISLISQDPMTALTPVHTIGAQIVEQIRAHENVSRRAAWARAVDLLRDVRIPSPEKTVERYPHELSGGMRQRAVIAMALSCHPALVVADEPTTALDTTVQAQVLDLLRGLRKSHGSSVVLITHDMGVVAEMADQVAVMYAGRVVESGPVADVFNDPWHPYTWGLLASIPPLTGERQKRLYTIPGMPPAPGTPLPGCAYVDRCPVAMAVCHTPPPEQTGRTHRALCFIDAEKRPAAKLKAAGTRI